MKKKSDPRHKKRIRLIKKLFIFEFNSKQKSLDIKEIVDNFKKIDKKIKEAAPLWPIEKINKIDLAILRLSVFELLLIKREPPKVIIDEAVELAKEYGSDTTPAFVNGVLGKLVELEKIKI